MLPRSRWILGAIWLAFIIRAAFYCQLIPLWEGYDEWAHYAFLEHLRIHGSLPRTSDGVTEEIHQSVASAKFRHEAAEPMHLFEAQQPPLYYWLLYLPNRIWIHAPIAARVFRLRILSVLIVSLIIPIAYLAALRLFHNRAQALTVCALIASMPALMIDIARVSNEGLAILLVSCLTLQFLSRQRYTLGLTLGLGLLTKAYFLVFIPILIFRRRFYSLALAIAMAGWWYWRNLRLTRTLTGEVTDVALSHLGWPAKLAAVWSVPWLKVLDSAIWSHIWTGAWSFFTARSWMYRVFEVIFALCAIMLILALIRRPFGRFKSQLSLLISLEVLFAAAISYQALSVWITKNLAWGNGWYFCALVVAEALLLVSGLMILVGRRRLLLATTCLTALYAALDLYTVNFILARHYSAPVSIVYVIATAAVVILCAAS